MRKPKYQKQSDGLYHCLKCNYKHEMARCVGRHAVVHKRAPYKVKTKQARLAKKENHVAKNHESTVYLAGKIAQQIKDTAGAIGKSESQLATEVLEVLHTTLVW